MNLNLTRSEIETIRAACGHMIDCEKGAIHDIPESADVFRQEVRKWTSIRRKINKLKKAKRFAPTTRRK